MKKKKQRKLRARWGFFVYLLLLVYATILTQLLRNPLSAVLFWFLLIIGPASLVLVAVGRAVIQVYVSSTVERTEKMRPVEYEIRIINQSPIPFPFVEAAVTQPSDDGVRSRCESLVLSLIPFGGYIVKKTVAFRFRGLYEIGVKELYIGDFLGFWRLRVDIDNYSNVTVCPRRLPLLCPSDKATSDVPTQSVRVSAESDMSEVSNIREYRRGDSLKSVHWKLSSKAEELQVKDYNTNDDRHTYILVDLAAPTPAPEVRRAAAARKLKRVLRDRDREEMRLAAGKLLGGTGKLGERIKAAVDERREKAAERRKRIKYQKRRAKGNSAASIETMDMIDALIRETSGKDKKKKNENKNEKKKKKLALTAEEAEKLNEEKRARDEVIEKLSKNIDGNIKEAEKTPLTEAQRVWGGAVRTEYEDEMPELCADGVVEIAVSAALNEIRSGNKCTVCWYDGREDSGISVRHMTGSGEFEAAYASFAAAGVTDCEKRVSELSEIIGEAVNVTVKIVTANIDPQSLGEYAAVPAKFGGAGSGCVTELLLYNPIDKYTSERERSEYVLGAKARLRRSGIRMSEIVESTADGGMLVSDELL